VSDDRASAAPDAAPPLRLVRGSATAEEVAALVAVLAAAADGADAPPPAPLSAWADRARLVRAPVSPGPDGWRGSAFPR
jgi:acyl-CoA carboxylase epsilon subunit